MISYLEIDNGPEETQILAIMKRIAEDEVPEIELNTSIGKIKALVQAIFPGKSNQYDLRLQIGEKHGETQYNTTSRKGITKLSPALSNS